LLRKRLLGLLVAVAATAGLMASVSTAGCFSAGLTGAGSTLVAPLIGQLISGYRNQKKASGQIRAVGSGTGIAQNHREGPSTSALGCSTDPGNRQLPATAASRSVGPLGHRVGFNVPGVKKLNLTGKILAGIYFGKITNWTTPRSRRRIQKRKLPN